MKRMIDSRHRSWWVFALGALGALLLLAGPLADKSEAGTFFATECASWNSYSQANYSETGHSMGYVVRQCQGGGDGLGIALPANYLSGYGTEARWELHAPTGTRFLTVSLNQRGLDADGWYRNVIACGDSGCTELTNANDGVWRGTGTSGSYRILIARLYCLSGGGCGRSPQAGLFVRDVNMIMSDDVTPAARQRGELLNGEVQRGIGRLDVSATDIGGGLAYVRILVNGEEVARRNLACHGSPMQPCAADSGPLAFDLNTQAAPFHDGNNTVQTCATDYGDSGNSGCSALSNVGVDNSCVDSRVPGGADLSALFARNRKDILGVRAGQGALLAGRLTDSSGAPVAGASLCVREAVPGAGPRDEGTVKTNADGRYRYGVTPGPNRDLQIGYRFNRKELDRQARFFSKTRPRLKLSRRRTSNGQSIRLFGSIPGPSNNDRVVILQAGYPHSGKWKTFSKARTGPKGDYVAQYRFTSTFQTTAYRMRAVVPKQNGYPYAGGASRARQVKVLGS